MSEKTIEVKKQEVEAVNESEPTRARQSFIPTANIYETENQFTILADLPGVDEKSVDITLEKNELTINGYVKPSHPEGFNLAYGEYQTGDYRRKFILSDEVDHNSIEASVKNGVLKLVLTKSQDYQARKIMVKAG